MNDPTYSRRRSDLVNEALLTLMTRRLVLVAVRLLAALAMLAASIGAAVSSLGSQPVRHVLLLAATAMAVVGLLAALWGVLSARRLNAKDPLDDLAARRPPPLRAPTTVPAAITVLLIGVVAAGILGTVLQGEAPAFAVGAAIGAVVLGLIGPVCLLLHRRTVDDLAAQREGDPALAARIDDLEPYWAYEELSD